MGKRVLRRKKSVLRRLAGVLYGLLVALSAVIVALYVIYNVMKEEPTMAAGGSPPPVASGQQDPQTSADPQGLTRKEGTYTVLLTCPDVASGNADTIMVAMYDTVNQKAGLVSIPRDTLVEGESPGGNHYYKINSSYHYGIDELKETVSDLLGIPIEVHDPALGQALSSLSPKRRDVVLLFYFAQIGKLLNITTMAVNSRRRKALAALRELLEVEYGA